MTNPASAGSPKALSFIAVPQENQRIFVDYNKAQAWEREPQLKLVIATHVHHLGLRDDILQTMQLSVTRLYI